MSEASVADVRDALRTAEDELTRASHLLSTVAEFAEARKHGGSADPTPVERAATRFLEPGPGPNYTVPVRRSELSYLGEPLLDEDGDFFAAARAYESSANRTGSGDGSLSALVDDLERFVTGASDHTPAAETVATLAAADDRAMAGHLRVVVRRLVSAARAKRDAVEDRLNDQYAEQDDGSYTQTNTGRVQQFLDSVDDTVSTLSDEPIALLPVRLETRFVEDDLLVRVYPDRIHEDSHEPQLTDAERTWGQNFWAYVWYATVETPVPRELSTNLPAERQDELVAMLVELPDSGYPDDPAERKRAIRTRAWGQLVERFGRERAKYVVHALRPDVDGSHDWMTLLDGSETAESVGALAFPDPDGRPGSWTRAPVARLLPDEWLVYGVWTADDDYDGEGDTRETFLVHGGAIREPLRVGPDPDAMAVATQAVADTPEGTRTEAGIDWLVDFAAAERAGMALRITPADVHPGGDRPLDEGWFEQLVVTGVKATMDADESARQLRELLAAQQYTNGLSLVPQGTPTNNADRPSGYHSGEDPEDTVDVDAGAPLVEHGDMTDGDVLARALAVDPSSLGDDDHVFAHVADADATDQLDAWHANSALWSGTLGYYIQTMLRPNRFDDSDATPPLFDQLDDPDISTWFRGDDPAGWYEAYRRHFIEYVRAGGPLPTLRAGRQPYGFLPATVSDPDSDARLWAGGGALDGIETGDDHVSVGGGVSIAEAADDRDGWSIGDIRIGGSDGGSSEEASETTLRGNDPAYDYTTGSSEEFRRTYRPEDARDEIPDAYLARTFEPAETRRVFSASEMATHYSPDEASSVLSTDELNENYSREELAASSVETDADGRAIDPDGGGGRRGKRPRDDDDEDSSGGIFR
ncbi:hypothetical protein [Haloarchaeobius litoreus]|uniref:Uncharacterized protein n=1 Tax=Haloarchaeobius litoreus TaxID=755306 RepID=A0ABD6DEX5_9EURY|nr:hypothetical protein [Haloarchaeobius litoreus]